MPTAIFQAGTWDACSSPLAASPLSDLAHQFQNNLLKCHVDLDTSLLIKLTQLPLLSSFCSHHSTENAPQIPMTSSLPNGHCFVLTFLDHSLGAPVISNPFLPGNCLPGFLWSQLLLSVLLPLVTPELTLSFLP